MLYSFGARNYFSFKEGFEVSFELNSKVPKSISKSRKCAYVMGIKGANASGKTAILRSLQFLGLFVAQSFSTAERTRIHVESYFDNSDPTEFYVDFESNGIRYTYELACTDEKIISEKLYKKVSRKTRILERSGNELKYRTSDLSLLDLVILKDKASIISTAKNYKFPDIYEDLRNCHEFFASIDGNLSALTVMDDSSYYSYDKISELYENYPDAFEFAKNIIRKCDLGVEDIMLVKTKNTNGEDTFRPFFSHKSKAIEEHWLGQYNESEGTNALYRRLGFYWAILDSGGILLMDEFDTKLHPDLLPLIVDLFDNEDTNPHGAQFLFTSHNLEIIDYLGKYRTILVSKEELESFSYRLDEIPGDIIRNDRAISSLYRDGRLGGVPKL